MRLAWAPFSQSDSQTAFDDGVQIIICSETGRGTLAAGWYEILLVLNNLFIPADQAIQQTLMVQEVVLQMDHLGLAKLPSQFHLI